MAQKFEIDEVVLFDELAHLVSASSEEAETLFPWPAQIMGVNDDDTYTIELYHPENTKPYSKRSPELVERFTRRNVKYTCMNKWKKEEEETLPHMVTLCETFLHSVQDARASIKRHGRKQKTPC
mgnify:FL=1|tara:strand:+ start:3551 stop:3922 length:372 start_codon:yes stop_codon:yes gene_type:complete